MGFLCKQAEVEHEIATPNSIDSWSDILVDATYAGGLRPTSRELSRAEAGSMIGRYALPILASPFAINTLKGGVRDVEKWGMDMRKQVEKLPLDKVLAGVQKFLRVSSEGKREMAAKAISGRIPIANETLSKLWSVSKRIPLSRLGFGLVIPVGAGILGSTLAPVAIGANSWWRDKPNTSQRLETDNNNSSFEDRQGPAAQGASSDTDIKMPTWQESQGPITLPGRHAWSSSDNNNNQHYSWDS